MWTRPLKRVKFVVFVFWITLLLLDDSFDSMEICVSKEDAMASVCC